MASIHYLSEIDKVKTFNTYKPIVLDLSKEQLEILILMILNGTDVEYAFDLAMSFPKN